MTTQRIEFKKDDIICDQGSKDTSLFLLESGRAMAFGVEGTKVTPFAYIDKGEFIGELSYFDNQSRSAYVIAIEDCVAISISSTAQKEVMPDWMIKLATNITKRLRHIDDVISSKGVKRTTDNGIAPLTIAQQREIYQLINKE